nr:hypothetical protein [Bacteroidota bacterium]
MKTENKHISEEDFRRYLEDKMSTTERNAFERELERHPFEAEALEGFQHISSGDLQKDLLELRERIRPKKRNLKLRYWAAAASVLIITATGIIWFNFDKSLSPPRIAENSAVEKTAEEFLSPEVKEESLSSENTYQSIPAEKKGKGSDEKRAGSNIAAHPEKVTEPLAPEPESLPEMLVEDSESEELTFVEDAIEADILAEEIA